MGYQKTHIHGSVSIYTIQKCTKNLMKLDRFMGVKISPKILTPHRGVSNSKVTIYGSVKVEHFVQRGVPPSENPICGGTMHDVLWHSREFV